MDHETERPIDKSVAGRRAADRDARIAFGCALAIALIAAAALILYLGLN